jgi:hypothetical protein
VSTEAELVAAAKAALVALVDAEHAVVWSEVEAKLSEEAYAGYGKGHMPHSLTIARQELVRGGKIVQSSASSRGAGPEVQTLTPADTARRSTKIRDAAARKRLLMARYRGWASGNTTYPHGLVGPAGEQAVRTALVDAGNLALVEPGAGEVKRLLGIKLPGSLDSAGWLPLLTSDGVPEATTCVPVEVKNIRDWLYPQAPEVYQLLHKAALLQRAAPDTPVHPVLICRRAHYTLFFMAKQFGFKVHDAQRQYIRDAVKPESLQEVRNELGFQDLLATPIDSPPDKRLVRFFRVVLPKGAKEACTSWRETVLTHNLDQHFALLRDPGLRLADRGEQMGHLRVDAHIAGLDSGW